MAEKLFVVGGEVEPPYFIGREQELKKLAVDVLVLAPNTVITGPPKIGKTTLLKNLKSKLEKEVLFVPVNCRRILELSDFFRITALALAKAHEEKHEIRNLSLNFSEIFRENTDPEAASAALAEIGGCMEAAGKVYLKFRAGKTGESELIPETFALLENFSQEIKKPVVVAFDEYQELGRFKESVFKTLKTRPAPPPELRYIFSGSSASLLHEIFIKPASPLHLPAAISELSPIAEKDLKKYIKSRLATGKIDISKSALEKVHELTGGFPFYFQKLGILLHQEALLEEKPRIKAKDVDRAFAAMLEELDSEFEARFAENFSAQQKKVLRVLSAEKQKRLSQIARDLDTPASSLTTSMRGLYGTMTVGRPEEGLYEIADPVFRLWIKRKILGPE